MLFVIDQRLSVVEVEGCLQMLLPGRLTIFMCTSFVLLYCYCCGEFVVLLLVNYIIIIYGKMSHPIIVAVVVVVSIQMI